MFFPTLRAVAVAAVTLCGPAVARDAAPTALQFAVAEGVAALEDADGPVAAFYRMRDFAPLWTAGDLPSRARLGALLEAIRDAEAHGLPSARWDAEGLRSRIAAARAPQARGRLEVELTETYLDFAHALTSGVIDPSRVDPDIRREIPRADDRALLDAMDGGDPAEALRALAPRSFEYGRLMMQRRRLAEIVGSGGWGPAVPPGRLAPGASGEAVVALRDRLRAMGFMGRSVSSRYDDALTEAVRTFQEASGLEVDGIAGASTIEAVNVPAAERLGAVLVAMERERWMDRERGARHVWVNLADFHAAVVDDGVVTFRTRAVIGADHDGRETPEFSESMSYMVVNPSWHVPRSITVNEYLPRLRANPAAVPHLEVIDRSGRVVSRGRSFAGYTARTFPFSMRQPPGPRNALGRVKFMFPNPYAIYLHDTPARDLFARERRAFSHGCIRLNDPLGFAYHLLAAQEDEPQDFFDSILGTRAERRVDLEDPVPVHLVYRTAFTDHRGTLHTRPDVYGRDARLLAALLAAGVPSPADGT
ncbi:murein L,D-transpeptidase YcbB/YkuD [Hasllibacter halocynthiae]|uniref:Murein L,D-transpeptidase YcbB/YkuD n=1 Tax=Hasllibacter halocynthiae TaxID=595589 RepID=A0A2T0X8I9_9RHOB|nr:L,D-transpeptidase family protein [Hasllibacter halocynthiae]PRY95239.1 murein L,D-transpeptidase YcbB/YkuD [Hasllibacter halocynthiae]